MKFKYDLAAAVLLDALFSTDEEACKKYGISARTLRRYRERQTHDPDLVALVLAKKAILDQQWADELPKAMRQALKAITVIAEEMQTNPAARRNPLSLEKLAGALKLCADVYYTGKVIEARLKPQDAGTTGQNRAPGQVPGEGATESATEYPN